MLHGVFAIVRRYDCRKRSKKEVRPSELLLTVSRSFKKPSSPLADAPTNLRLTWLCYHRRSSFTVRSKLLDLCSMSHTLSFTQFFTLEKLWLQPIKLLESHLKMKNKLLDMGVVSFFSVSCLLALRSSDGYINFTFVFVCQMTGVIVSPFILTTIYTNTRRQFSGRKHGVVIVETTIKIIIFLRLSLTV